MRIDGANLTSDYFNYKNWLIVLEPILHLNYLYQDVSTLIKGRQTEQLLNSKKIDAIFRSMPSMVLQLYSFFLLLSTDDVGSAGKITFLISISSGAVGMCIMLASLSLKSSNKLVSWPMLIVAIYFHAEVALRVITLSIMFVSIHAVTFVIIGAELLVRASVLKFDFGAVDISSTIIWFGSDYIFNDAYLFAIGTFFTCTKLFIFLIIINLLDMPDLCNVRDAGIVKTITIISSLPYFFNRFFTLLFRVIPLQ